MPGCSAFSGLDTSIKDNQSKNHLSWNAVVESPKLNHSIGTGYKQISPALNGAQRANRSLFP